MPNRTLIGSLTALRFFAALAIVVLHSNGILLPPGTVQGVWLGHGVSFFFVLSGFILTYVHQDGMQGLDLRSFYRARFARIWPATVFSLFVLVVLLPPEKYFPNQVVAWGGLSGLSVLAANVFMVQSWIPVPAYYFVYNSVAWSVSNEIFFYLTFPFLLRSWSRTWIRKTSIVFAVGLGLVLTADLLNLAPFGPGPVSRVSAEGIAYFNPLVRMKEFVIGMVAALAFMRTSRTFTPPRWLLTMLEVALVISLPFVVRGIRPLYAPISPITLLPPLSLFRDQTLVAIFFAAIIIVFAFNGGTVSRILSFRFFVVLGEISFSIYLLHQIFLKFYQTHEPSFGWIPPSMRFSTFLAVTCLAAYGSWRFVESPSRHWLRTGFRRRSKLVSSDARKRTLKDWRVITLEDRALIRRLAAEIL